MAGRAAGSLPAAAGQAIGVLPAVAPRASRPTVAPHVAQAVTTVGCASPFCPLTAVSVTDGDLVNLMPKSL
jgi:hypothetical protein